MWRLVRAFYREGKTVFIVMENKILIIIPAYNEENNIANVVDTIITQYGMYDYVVVNDGSSDNTYKICQEKKYNVINMPVNLGLAGAFQAGMKYADYLGYDYAIQIDGDGQHNVDFVAELARKANEENYDITIGSRFINEKKPFNMRMIGSRVISGLIQITTGKKIKDPTSGMRLYNKQAIRFLSNQMNFGPEPDTISFLMNNGYSVGETQVYMNERVAGKSYLVGFESVKYMLKTCFSILLMKLL